MTTLTTLATQPEVPVTWLVLRTTGIVAIVLLSLSTVIGIASPALRSPTRRLVAISTHSAAAATGLVLLVGHIVLAIVDSYIHISPLAAVIPGASSWEPLWIGIGTIAFDLLLLLLVTTLTRLRAPRLWRRIHLVSYAAVALAWAHALAVGTDANAALWLTAVLGLVAAALAAVFRVNRSRSTPQPTTPVTTTRIREYA